MLVEKEIEIREAIEIHLFKAKEEEHKENKRLKLIIKTPRLHRKYLEDHNIKTTFIT